MKQWFVLIPMVLSGAVLSACSTLSLVNAVSPSAHYLRASGLGYGEAPRQRLDVYRPRNVSEGAPLVVYFYGGGWDNGDRKDYEFVAASLTRAGIVVVIPDYRLFPEVRFPTFVEDGARAVAWAIENAHRYGADNRNIYLMGHSAGAHIAALIALDERYLATSGNDPARLAGFIGLSGPYDFLPIKTGYLLELFPEEVRAQSQPIDFVSAKAPPALLIHGEDDEIVLTRNSERLAARLRSVGVPVTLKLYPGVGHARVLAALAPPLDFVAATLEDCVAFVQAIEVAHYAPLSVP